MLVLGSGSGGWVTDAYNEYFLLAIPKMRHLVKFSLMYNCTENVLQVREEFVRIEGVRGGLLTWLREMWTKKGRHLWMVPKDDFNEGIQSWMQ